MGKGNILEFIVQAVDKASPTLDKVGSEVEGSASKWKGVMVGASSAIAAAWGALQLGDIVSNAMDLNSAQSKLSAQLGAFGPESAELGRVAGEVWASGFAESTEQVNEAVGAVKRNLGDLNEVDLSAASEQVLALADMSGESANKIAAAAGKMVKTGVADSWQQALDVITRGFQSNANEAEDLLDTFQEYSTEFRQLGLSGAEALGLMNQGLAAGARNGDVVADALKEFAIRGQAAVTLSSAQITAAQDKERSSAEALVRAQDAVRASGQSLARAQESERAAQEAVNQARKQARQDLADLKDSLDDARFDTKGAELSVARAKERLQQVMADSTSSDLDISEATYGVEQAQRALDDQRKRVDELAKAKEDADKKGVEGSDKVQAAQRAARDAHTSTTAAVEAYRKAQVDAETAAKTYAAALSASKETLTPLGQAYRRIGVDAQWAQQAIAAGGPGATAALQKVLDGLRKVKDPAERSALAVTFFGTKAEDLQEALYALDPKTATKGLENVAGATDQVVEAMAGSPQAKVAAMRNQFDLWKASLIDTEGPVGTVATAIGAFGGDIGGLIAGLGPLLLMMPGVGATSIGAAGGVGAFAASMWAATWPILAVIAAVALLVAGVWLIIDNWDVIGPWLAGLWDGIAKTAVGAWDGITKWWGGVWGGIMKVAGGVWDGIKKIWEWTPLGFIITNWKPIVGFFTGIGDGISKAFKWSLRTVAVLWNATVGSLSWTVPGWIPFIGGQTWSVPKMAIPALASGGIVTGPTLALIGEAGDEAVVPLDRGGAMVTVPISLIVDGKVLAEVVADAELKRGW